MPKLTIKKEGIIDYIEILPDNYDPAKKYALCIFLHGIDGRISVEYLRDKEIPVEVQAWAELKNMLILCPYTASSFGKDHALNMAAVATRLPINSTRILTGLSFGGGGVLALLSIPGIAQLFNAAIVVCGIQGVDGCEIANSKIPLILFHAKNDSVVKIQDHGYINRDRIIACGGKPLFIELPDGDHWIWGRVYNHLNKYSIEGKDQSVIDWALSKVKIADAPIPNPPGEIFSVKAPEDFTTTTPIVKLKAEVTGEDWDKNKARWTVIEVPTGVNKYAPIVTAGGGWIDCHILLPKPGRYVFESEMRSVTGKVAKDQVVVTWEPGAPIVPSKPIEAEGMINGKRYLLFTDKTWEQLFS